MEVHFEVSIDLNNHADYENTVRQLTRAGFEVERSWSKLPFPGVPLASCEAGRISHPAEAA